LLFLWKSGFWAAKQRICIVSLIFLIVDEKAKKAMQDDCLLLFLISIWPKKAKKRLEEAQNSAKKISFTAIISSNVLQESL
jgi:hypothetical protein